MPHSVFFRTFVTSIVVLFLNACGDGTDQGEEKGTPWYKKVPPKTKPKLKEKEEKIWDFMRDTKPEQVTKVNQYIWRAALEVLDFLPVEAVDPFSGVVVTGYGKPPGGDLAYRATIFVSDPALDARSLKLSLQTKSGPVSFPTQRAIENAILTRARQLRKDAGRY
ncbi:MAG: DUF3576 domain-containing protein [Paracoccaceae bacterium]|nr:DUF3576 domain-containing protein [Paracoccaceae bacterium]